MNLRVLSAVSLTLTAFVIAAGCAKEQPAAKDAVRSPVSEPGPAETGQVCDTVATAAPAGPAQPTAQRSTRAGATQRLPRLVDLGRGTCIPCKQMAPILKELTEEYRGRAIVEVIDLREKPEAAQEFKIKLIPTQVFFDKNGAEVWRHEGFLPKDQIVAKFQELGAKSK